MKKIIFTQDQINDIVNKYQNNWNQQSLATYYNVSRRTIKRILLEQEEIIIRQKTPKYKANYNIFEEINTAEKAYWLGFLAADGCNYQRAHNASIILNIHAQDIEHLKKFQQFCNTNTPIISYTGTKGYSNQTPMVKITLNSMKMSNDLIDKGIIPNKSLRLKKPNISEQFYLPFILGYFDGDGCISKTSQYNNYSIAIQGTKEMLLWISSILNWDAKLEKRITTKTTNNYYIRCGGTNKPYQLLQSLYKSCTIHLNRKYNIYKALEAVVLNRNAK